MTYFIKKIRSKLRIGFNFGIGRSFGKISVHHKGCFKVKNYKCLDFIRRINSYGFIFRIFKSNIFTSFLALVIYENGLSNYILLSENINKDILFFQEVNLKLVSHY